MTALWPAGFAPFFRPNWGLKIFFSTPPPPNLKVWIWHLSLFLFHCVSWWTAWPKTSTGSPWDQEWPRWKWESFIFHLFVVHLLQPVTLLITVYSNIDLKHQHPEWKRRWPEVNWHIHVLLRVPWGLSSSGGFMENETKERFYSCRNESFKLLFHPHLVQSFWLNCHIFTCNFWKHFQHKAQLKQRKFSKACGDGWYC